MEPHDIEFVGSEESAPAPVPWERPARSHVPRTLLAVLVVAGGVAWAVTRSSGSGQDPVAARPTPSPVHVAPPAPTATASTRGQFGTTDIGKAVAQYLPAAIVTDVAITYTTQAGTGQTSESGVLIELHQGAAEVFVQVRPYLRPLPVPTTGITPTPPGLGSSLFHFETAASVVDVQWIGTAATPPPVDALAALADDPRLESPS